MVTLVVVIVHAASTPITPIARCEKAAASASWSAWRQKFLSLRLAKSFTLLISSQYREQECPLEDLLLAQGDRDAQDLTLAVEADPDGDQDRCIAYLTILTHFLIASVQENIPELPQRSCPECRSIHLHLLVFCYA